MQVWSNLLESFPCHHISNWMIPSIRFPKTTNNQFHVKVQADKCLNFTWWCLSSKACFLMSIFIGFFSQIFQHFISHKILEIGIACVFFRLRFLRAASLNWRFAGGMNSFCLSNLYFGASLFFSGLTFISWLSIRNWSKWFNYRIVYLRLWHHHNQIVHRFDNHQVDTIHHLINRPWIIHFTHYQSQQQH